MMMRRSTRTLACALASVFASVFVLPAEVGWSDIGSWAAVYELLARKSGENVSAGRHVAIDAHGNFLWSPKKFIAAVGVREGNGQECRSTWARNRDDRNA